MERSTALEFLTKAQQDRELNGRLLAAFEEGGRITQEQVTRIAQEAGYDFTTEEFQAAVRENIAERFAAGEKHLGDVAVARPIDAPQSSCAYGCLSYTKSWHP